MADQGRTSLLRDAPRLNVPTRSQRPVTRAKPPSDLTVVRAQETQRPNCQAQTNSKAWVGHEERVRHWQDVQDLALPT